MLKIKPARIYFPNEDIARFQEGAAKILKTGQLILGEHTKGFEEAVCAQVGTKHAIAVSSGTHALEIAFRALNIKDKQIIIPTNTFIATANAARYAGGNLVFCDLNPAFLAPSLEQIKKLVTNETGAIVLVHIGGHITPEIEAIASYCQEKGIPLVEDAAHAHGASMNGKPAGSFGDISTFSYFPTKVITTNEGGMIVTNNDKIASQARAMRDHGKIDKNSNFHQIDGNSWRMTEMNALLGELQMTHLQDFIEHRQKIANLFDKAFLNDDLLKPFFSHEHGVANFYKYILIPHDTVNFDRDYFKQRLVSEYGVKLSGEVYTHGCHEQPVLKKHGFDGGPFDNAEKFCRSHVCLPVYNNMTRAEVDIITNSIRELISKL